MEKFVRTAAALMVCTTIGWGLAGCKRSEYPPPAKPATPVPEEPAAPVLPEPVTAPSQPVTAPETASAPKPGPAATGGVTKGPATVRAREPIVLRAVRTGAQPGADRIVFEFSGAGVPAWEVEYVDRPVNECGSGDPVTVAGDALLQIRFTGVQAHTNAGVATSGPRRRPLAHAVARELVRICDFEGEVTWVLGVARPNAYTPRIMSSPSRFVIDIAH